MLFSVFLVILRISKLNQNRLVIYFTGYVVFPFLYLYFPLYISVF